MKENLYELACQYVQIIRRIEETTDAEELRNLEERRVDLHGKFMDLLNEQGIRYKDREHATRIAEKIAKEEL